MSFSSFSYYVNKYSQQSYMELLYIGCILPNQYLRERTA